MYVAPMMTRSTARFASLIGGDDAAAQRRRRARDSRAYLEDRALADLQAVVSREPSSPSDQLVLEDRCEALEVPLLELCSLADLWVCCRCRRCNESLSCSLAHSRSFARSLVQVCLASLEDRECLRAWADRRSLEDRECLQAWARRRAWACRRV